MSVTNEIPTFESEIADLDSQAARFVAAPSYALYTPGRAYKNFLPEVHEVILSTPGIEPEGVVDLTGYYTHRKDLNPVHTSELAEENDDTYHDLVKSGLAQARELGVYRRPLILYKQGELIESEGEMPADSDLDIEAMGLTLPPNCASLCLWVSREIARANAMANVKHHRSSEKAGEWFEESGILKGSIKYGKNSGDIELTIDGYRPIWHRTT